MSAVVCTLSHEESPSDRPRDEFTQLVRRIVIYEHRGVLRELAGSLGLSYGAFYNRLNGRGAFDPHEVNLLLRQLADPRLIECLLSGTEFQAIRKPVMPEAHSNQDLAEIALSCALKTLSVVQVTIHSLRRHKLDRETGVQLGTIVCHAQQELSTLHSALSEAYR